MQAAERGSGEHEPLVALDARRAELVEVDARFQQFDAVARVTGMHQRLVVRGERVGEDRDLDIALSQLSERMHAHWPGDEVGR